MTFDDDTCWSHVLRRFTLFLPVEAETGTLFHEMAFTVEMTIHFYLELRAVAVPLDEKAIVEFDAGRFIFFLSF